MGFKIREMNGEGKFSQALTIEALSRVIPPDNIKQGVQQTVAGQTRERTLTLPVMVWLVIALHMYTTLPISAVLAKLARGGAGSRARSSRARVRKPGFCKRPPPQARTAVVAMRWGSVTASHPEAARSHTEGGLLPSVWRHASQGEQSAQGQRNKRSIIYYGTKVLVCQEAGGEKRS